VPFLSEISNRIVEFFRRTFARPNIGTQLFYLMQEAGLPPPECRAEMVMDGGPHSPIYEWLSETAISLSPHFQALGIPPLPSTDGAALTRQLRESTLEKRSVVVGPMMVGAFARKR
jgi:hypothetical protein